MTKKALRDLRRRRPQVAAIAVTVMLGVLLFVASYDSFRNLKASYDRTYHRTHFADLAATGGNPAAVAASVRANPDVEKVSVRTQADQPMTIASTKLLGRVVGFPPDDHGVNKTDVTAGDRPRPDATDRVLVERHAADTFHLAAGDRLAVFDGTRWRDVTISGVAVSPCRRNTYGPPATGRMCSPIRTPSR